MIIATLATLFQAVATFTATVEADLEGPAERRCDAVFISQTQSGSLALVRAERWAFQVTDEPMSDRSAARPHAVIMGEERAVFRTVNGSRVAEFSSTNDSWGRLAQDGSIAVQYELEGRVEPIIRYITLSQGENLAWRSCVMTLTQFDRYGH